MNIVLKTRLPNGATRTIHQGMVVKGGACDQYRLHPETTSLWCLCGYERAEHSPEALGAKTSETFVAKDGTEITYYTFKEPDAS
jgi:hypothetical protein